MSCRKRVFCRIVIGDVEVFVIVFVLKGYMIYSEDLDPVMSRKIGKDAVVLSEQRMR